RQGSYLGVTVSVKIPVDASWGWRKILKLRQLVRKVIQHIPDDGQDINLSCPLLEVYGNSIVQDARLPSQANWLENKRIHQNIFKIYSAIVHEIQSDVKCKILSFARPTSSICLMAIAYQWGLR
ncbi:hypothetical protein SLEP1_g60519, partial [Rubroshorea leprosula]